MKVKAKFVFLIQGSLEPPSPWFNHLACSRFYSLKAALIMLGTREGYREVACENRTLLVTSP